MQVWRMRHGPHGDDSYARETELSRALLNEGCDHHRQT